MDKNFNQQIKKQTSNDGRKENGLFAEALLTAGLLEVLNKDTEHTYYKFVDLLVSSQLDSTFRGHKTTPTSVQRFLHIAWLQK